MESEESKVKGLRGENTPMDKAEKTTLPKINRHRPAVATFRKCQRPDAQLQLHNSEVHVKVGL